MNLVGLYSSSGGKVSWRQSARLVSPEIPLKLALADMMRNSPTGANAMSQLYVSSLFLAYSST